MEPAKSMEQSHRERQELYRKLWAENQWLYGVWGVVIGLLIAAVIGGNESVWGVLVSFAPEFAGLLFVTLVLDRRAEHRERERRKQQLIRDMGSGPNEFARRAVNELRHEKWLTDGTLRGAELRGANLQGAELMGANLQGAHLMGADLQGVPLWGANLQGAYLMNANLQRAELTDANLQGAPLTGANLHGANLWEANLQGAHLMGADLQGADLTGANLQGANWDLAFPKFNDETCLPDGGHFDPQKGPEQLERFTNPKHPEFWRSDSQRSPAYRGDPETAGDG